MEQGEFSQYQQVSARFKEIVEAVTKYDLKQLKLFLVGLEKKIDNKESALYAQYKSVKQLLDLTKEAKGKVTLHYACARGSLEIVKLLVQTWFIDTNIKDKEGNTVLFTCIEHGHLELVKYFIEDCKASVTESKEGGIGCLHLASNHGHLDLMEYLIGKGADIQKISIYGKPLNWAVASNKLEAVKLLLHHKADPNGDFNGSTPSPLILAVDSNEPTMYNLLVEAGANVNVKDPNGYPILHVAAEKGILLFVKDLVVRGAAPNVQVHGQTALHAAFEKEHWDVVSYLRQFQPNYQQIYKQIQQKQQQDANKALRTNEDKAKAQQLKIQGNKLYGDKQYELALDQYNKALNYDGENEVIHRNIAASYLALQKYSEALMHCQLAKRKDPKNVKTIYREASAYQGLGNLIQAASSLWECSMLEPKNAYFRSEFQKSVSEARKQHNK